ncbi:MAG TPA: hypothetical protein PKM63_01085 [Panacibacter sp.]|nr:hypothetical protein [Panacibacter sp.]HNP42847.1 hypothetical protein [Panacibacter sp.]
MAKQPTGTVLSGKTGNLVFYEMEGKGYVRRKTSLDAKRFKSDKAFANSRASADRFKTGNMIAGEVYRALPAPQRQYAFFCQLKSEAIGLLKSGMTALLVKSHLEKSASL